MENEVLLRLVKKNLVRCPCSGFMDFPLKIVIFHSYVSLPEGTVLVLDTLKEKKTFCSNQPVYSPINMLKHDPETIVATTPRLRQSLDSKTGHVLSIQTGSIMTLKRTSF